MRQLGMTKIFGNVGSTEEPMLKDFPSDFEYILALQESVAVAMADAYAQASGKCAHVNLHTAAGRGNGMGNIESAFYNRTPLIITAGQHMREMLIHEPYLTNKNPWVQAEPWVKWSYEPARAEDVPTAFLRAYATAIQAPAGPVYLSLPMDDMDRECPGLPYPRKIEARLSAGKDVLARVAEALAESKTPVLVMGGAVDQCDGWHDAIALAEKLNAPVFSAPFEGRPGFPENHPLFRGGLLSGMSSVCKQLEGYDLVIVIGAPVFRYYPYAPGEPLPKGTRLIQLTDSAEEAARAVVGESILCDPGRACATLVELLPTTTRKAPAPVSETTVSHSPPHSAKDMHSAGAEAQQARTDAYRRREHIESQLPWVESAAIPRRKRRRRSSLFRHRSLGFLSGRREYLRSHFGAVPESARRSDR
jgi:benzoylformate decarboxylase